MKKTIFILLVLLITSFLTFGCVESEEPIGGDLDENGCLIGAGYSFNADVNACVRNWEINVSNKEAILIAVESLSLDSIPTIVTVFESVCENCFTVEISPSSISQQENIVVKIQDSEIVQEFVGEKNDSLYDNFVVEYDEEERKFNYSITLFAPRVCDSFEIVDEIIMESYPVQIMVELRHLQAQMVCAEVITPVVVNGSIEIDHIPRSITIKLDDSVVISTSDIANDLPVELINCTEEQLQAEFCTMEYAPVCGNNNVTYGNACVACSSGEIDYYIQGECAVEQKVYCTPEQKQAEICYLLYAPVCGDNNKTYGNDCAACASNEIDYYVSGEC